jgi:ferredoxin
MPCARPSPKMFVCNDNRQSEAVNPEGDTVENILDAAKSCPVSAIVVEDAEAGEQLFP